MPRSGLDRIRECTRANSQDVHHVVTVRRWARALSTATRMHDRVDVQARNLVAPPQSAWKGDDVATTAAIARLVGLSGRYAWPVILGFLLLAIVSGDYFRRHFAITSESNKLMSSSLPWRQQEVMLDLAFPQRIDRIVAVIDATTPEAADNAADALVQELASQPEVIRTISRAD